MHAVNGTQNHIHVLVELSPSILIADVAKHLKGTSSHYVNKESGLGETLYWQDGYGVLSLRKVEVAKVTRYIQNQKEHHQTGQLSKILEQIEPA